MEAPDGVHGRGKEAGVMARQVWPWRCMECCRSGAGPGGGVAGAAVWWPWVRVDRTRHKWERAALCHKDRSVPQNKQARIQIEIAPL